MKHAYSVCCTFSLVCIFLLFSSIWTAAATANEVSAQHVLEQAPLEVHVTTLTLEENDRSAKRRAEEKRQLLQRLVRKKSCTDQNHPRARLLTALHGFSRYEERNEADLQRWKTNYGHVPKHQKKILERAVHYSDKLSITEKLIMKNHELSQEIVEVALQFYGVDRAELDEHIKAVEAKGQVAERMSVSQALKHFVRDWSTEGAHERKTFSCILDTITQYSAGKNRSVDRPMKVLLPGAGLGRLGYEIADLEGYEVTVNEWSMYMNIAYRFIESLNSNHMDHYSFHPFVDSWSHHATTKDMQRAVSFPDVPVDSSSVAMIEGDFAQAVGHQKGHYDFVITHFFIDTARNLMNYFETIYSVLQKGGYWINSGPLLYGTGPWVQLSLDEIIAVSKDMGFEFVELGEGCGELTFPDEKVRWMAGIYGSNERALHMNGYRVQCWVARKL